MAALVEGERSDASEVDVVGSDSENNESIEGKGNSSNENEESHDSSADEEVCLNECLNELIYLTRSFLIFSLSNFLPHWWFALF